MKKGLFFSLLLIFGLTGCTVQPQATEPTSSAATNSAVTAQHTSSLPAASSSNLASLTYHSGADAVVAVNGNRSTLKAADWTSNHVVYSPLDTLNRTSSPNTAYLAAPNLANDSRRVRQFVEPTGWHQKFSGGEAIINRGHLIAYSLSKGIALDGSYEPSQRSGDQNNLKNLFTQTAFSNQELQTIYEAKVREALKEGKRVIYQAHAVFAGDDRMARGVQLQAISTDGTLNFNVYIFNVQPGFVFNYADGTSKVDSSMTVPKPADAPNFNDSRSERSSRATHYSAIYHAAKHIYHHYHRHE
ncbi:MAG: DNA/RNA non-specific endonuclease [Sporolactobacillus sp.]